MKTNWVYSIEDEANRLVQTAYNIAIGFYQANNFIVLPYLSRSNSANIVTFPLLQYNKIPRFWEQAKKAEVTNLPVKIDKQLQQSICDLLEKELTNKPNYEQTKKTWSKIEKEVIAAIYKVIPNKKGFIKEIIIHPTLFGTSCSFNWIDDKGRIIIYLREDQGVHAITEAIITSLTRRDVYSKLEGLWQESEVITDYLVTETAIAKVLQKYEDPKNYTPTLKGTRIKEHAKLLNESNQFYKALGIPSFEKPFGYNGLIPELFGKPILNLTASEKKVLLELIKKSNTIVTPDQIGEIIFKSEDDFSLYAISKTIQRLRDKLEQNGISGSYIQTLRSKGYLLNN